MPVELIITQGSKAGTAAPIHQGYYLVGRHKECQIRPKSRSVSRRHSLLMHNDDGFGILDLKSTRGTFVNGSRLVPHQWRVLSDGDEIRFGKVVFTVSIKQPAFANVGATDDSSDDGSSVATLPTSEAPESWQNLDVAEFLDGEDEDDFGLPYGRADDFEKNKSGSLKSKSKSKSSSNSDVLSDSAIRSGKAGDTMIGDAADDFDDETDIDKEVEVDAAPKKRPPRKKIDHDEYKRGSRKSLSLPTFGLSFVGGVNWKTIGAIVLTAVTIGAFAYQVYSFGRGPVVPIRENLD
ncbi:MAG: FHA domain-containing protein [Planctomycetales bacterium]|nr:FHA domain-containing protein [Planctomycetales bacterium]